MKQILSILFAVAVLASCKQGASEGTGGQSSGRIVYVNTDTLLNNYDLYKDVVNEFQNKQFALENELKKKSESFQNEVALFQRRIQAGGMTQQQGETTQQQLQKKEQDILLYRDNAASGLAEDQAKQTDEILTNIQAYLEKHNEDDRYDMVIGFSKGGGVLYAKNNLEITTEVLEGLNKEYADKKDGKKSEAKSDSTATK
ncbi:OmpH family outer membrane protein [Arcticibacterium luteifluviistationis]|uniref:Molecular chaperone Skp n=1 Tax=Arcticibacterium luteifluviistationis TaxID=1784714 RepID=A0A2Z4G9H4_9BACT|nr:OmpH family outer membrane protein [Arcticibacterium luteifluviistationis]AWV97735.1 molecular chaperone Skp [Arcticibacterium luteifluviistationis]